MSFKSVEQFESKVAEFYNAPFAVATDCCTHAVELCLRMKEPFGFTTVPKHTYISIPFTLKKLGLPWEFRDDPWTDFYYLGSTNIIDAAVYFQRGGYIHNTLMCLSFQFKKPLGLGRGGMVLCSTEEEYVTLKKMSYDGRYGDTPWAEQSIDTMGYHYYMTPETAQQGIDKLPWVAEKKWPQWSWKDYPDLSKMPVFEQDNMLYYV